VTDERVNVEILKLLVQIAWADHEVVPEETDFILDLAEQANASEFDKELFRQCLRDEAQLPAPDFGLLRQYKQEALAAAERLIAIDRRIADDEKATLAQVRELLEA